MDSIIRFEESLIPNNYAIGFIGAGNMASSLVKGIINYAKIPANQIYLSAPTNRRLNQFEEIGCHTTFSNQKLVHDLYESKKDFKILFLCIKPNVFMSDVDFSLIFNSSLNYQSSFIQIVSVMAGISLEQLKQKICCDNCFIFRTIPNTAAEFGEGVFPIAFYPKMEESPEEQKAMVILLSKLGLVFEATESVIDISSGLSSSGIAFALSFIQAMSDGGVKMGLTRQMSNAIASQTVKGAAELIIKSKLHPHQLIDNVCSPGGSTIAGLHALHKQPFISTIIDAVETSTIAAKNLCKK